MPALRIAGSEKEELLFRTIGIRPWEGHEAATLFLGREAEPPPDCTLYLRLPDSNDPMRETRTLARMLGGAIGLGELHW
jgi:hypothetical protein